MPPTIRTFDAHSDSLMRRFERRDTLNLCRSDDSYDADFPRMRTGGIDAVLMMVGDNDLDVSKALIAAVSDMERRHPDDVAVCRTQANIRTANSKGQTALVMSIEGQAMFEENIELLPHWYDRGIRVASLTHGGGAAGGGKFGSGPAELQVDPALFAPIPPADRAALRRNTRGLTLFGRETLDVMTRLGLPCDLAHVNDAVFWEVIDHGEVPVCCTHGNCYALCQHSRNLTDDMLRALAERNGVLGICFFPDFIDLEHPSVDRLADHFLHALEIMGEDHVGVGTDFDGLPPGRIPMIEHAGHMHELWDALARRGLSDELLAKIGMTNTLQLLPTT